MSCKNKSQEIKERKSKKYIGNGRGGGDKEEVAKHKQLIFCHLMVGGTVLWKFTC